MTMDSGCSSCGYQNPLGARFCSSCGAPLKARTPSSDVTEAFDPTATSDPFEIPEDLLVDMPEGTVGMFVVRQGPKRGSRIALDSEEVSIGRHPESDIFLDDVTVSRRHAAVTRVGAGYHVSDAGSLNLSLIHI